MGAVKVEIPDGMHKEIKELVKQGKYRSVADFFYVAGQKELERIRSNGGRVILIDSDRGCEVVQEGRGNGRRYT